MKNIPKIALFSGFALILAVPTAANAQNHRDSANQLSYGANHSPQPMGPQNMSGSMPFYGAGQVYQQPSHSFGQGYANNNHQMQSSRPLMYMENPTVNVHATQGQRPYTQGQFPMGQSPMGQSPMGQSFKGTPSVRQYQAKTEPNKRLRLKSPIAGNGFISRLLNVGTDKNLYDNYVDRIRGRKLPVYQAAPLRPHPLDQFQRWQTVEPQYKLYPGDQIDIVVASAPELNRTLTIGPDGRIIMPMSEPVMAAGHSMKAVETALTRELAQQLVDPRVSITPRAYAPQQVFVGGEVSAQGTYTLPGPVGTMEAILMAGGFTTAAQTGQVIVLRRGDSGGFMARTIDFKHGLHNPLSVNDNIQLRRGDIIFVPRSDIAEVGLFMQQYIRDALPVDINLSYNLGRGGVQN